MKRDKQKWISVQWNVIQPKEERNSTICYNMDELWRYYTKSDEPVTKGQMLSDFTSMRYLDSKKQGNGDFSHTYKETEF